MAEPLQDNSRPPPDFGEPMNRNPAAIRRRINFAIVQAQNRLAAQRAEQERAEFHAMVEDLRARYEAVRAALDAVRNINAGNRPNGNNNR